jgi:hypothetical protein
MEEKEYDEEDLDRAEYLIEKGYVENTGVYDLAKKLYSSRVKLEEDM